MQIISTLSSPITDTFECRKQALKSTRSEIIEKIAQGEFPECKKKPAEGKEHIYQRWVYPFKKADGQIVYLKATPLESTDAPEEKLVVKVGRKFELFDKLFLPITKIKGQFTIPEAPQLPDEKGNLQKMPFFGFLQEGLSELALDQMKEQEQKNIPWETVALGVIAAYILGMNDAHKGNIIIKNNIPLMIDAIRSLSLSNYANFRGQYHPFFRCGLLCLDQSKWTIEKEKKEILLKWFEKITSDLPKVQKFILSGKMGEKIRALPPGYDACLILGAMEERIQALKTVLSQDLDPDLSLRTLICRANPDYKFHLGLRLACGIDVADTLDKRIQLVFDNSGYTSLDDLLLKLPCDSEEIKALAKNPNLSLEDYFKKVVDLAKLPSMGAHISSNLKLRKELSTLSAVDQTDMPRENAQMLMCDHIANQFLDAEIECRSTTWDETQFQEFAEAWKSCGSLLVITSNSTKKMALFFQYSENNVHRVDLDYEVRPGKIKTLNSAGPFKKNTIQTVTEAVSLFKEWNKHFPFQDANYKRFTKADLEIDKITGYATASPKGLAELAPWETGYVYEGFRPLLYFKNGEGKCTAFETYVSHKPGYFFMPNVVGLCGTLTEIKQQYLFDQAVSKLTFPHFKLNEETKFAQELLREFESKKNSLQLQPVVLKLQKAPSHMHVGLHKTILELDYTTAPGFYKIVDTDNITYTAEEIRQRVTLPLTYECLENGKISEKNDDPNPKVTFHIKPENNKRRLYIHVQKDRIEPVEGSEPVAKEEIEPVSFEVDYWSHPGFVKPLTPHEAFGKKPVHLSLLRKNLLNYFTKYYL